MSNALRTIILVMVSLVWALNFTAPVFVRNYKPPAEINVAFMGTVGALIATYKNDRPNGPGPGYRNDDRE